MNNTTFLEALREIRPLIESGRQRFICHALGHIDCGRFGYRIMAQLEGHATYSDWLKDKHRDFYLKMHQGDARPGRLAWIDDMIEREESMLNS